MPDDEQLSRIEARLAAIEERQRSLRPMTAGQAAQEARAAMRAGYAAVEAERAAAGEAGDDE